MDDRWDFHVYKRKLLSPLSFLTRYPLPRAPSSLRLEVAAAAVVSCPLWEPLVIPLRLVRRSPAGAPRRVRMARATDTHVLLPVTTDANRALSVRPCVLASTLPFLLAYIRVYATGCVLLPCYRRNQFDRRDDRYP